MSHKIEFKLVKLKAQKPVKTTHAFLELFDDHMFYRLDFVAEEWNDPDDEMMGKTEAYNYFDTLVMKDKISAIELAHLSDTGLWRILIAATGLGEDFKIYFKEKDPAEKMRKELVEWKLKK